MKFLVKWGIQEDKRRDVLATFSQMTPADDQVDQGDTLTVIGRWILPSWEGLAVVETGDPSAITGWLLNWMDAVRDVDVTPILDDAEMRELGKRKLAG